MLQQTQVSTVIPYFQRFMTRFPTVSALANGSQDDVLALWSGLGYYARGRNLHRAACLIRDNFGGTFPCDLASVMSLPGVGRSTAGAICVFAFGHSHAILDGNVKRVLARAFAVHGYAGERKVEDQLWQLSTSLVPEGDIEAYTQGLMDLGASVCARSRPACAMCPLSHTCVARREHLVDQLPTPRPKQEIPHRRTTMLMLWDGHEVLLERRPSPGIWGGLWCFPEVEGAQCDWHTALQTRYGVRDAQATRLNSVEHGFTHFKLTIEPYLVNVTRAASMAQAPGIVWLSLENARTAALPAPVRGMLHLLLAT